MKVHKKFGNEPKRRKRRTKSEIEQDLKKEQTEKL